MNKTNPNYRFFAPIPDGYEVGYDSESFDGTSLSRVLVPQGYQMPKLDPDSIKMLLASTSRDKFDQNSLAIHQYPPASEYVTDVLGSVEDSMEEPDNVFAIVADKLAKSIEQEWADIDAETSQAALRMMGASGESAVVIYSEDRGMQYQMTPQQMEKFKAHPVWNGIRKAKLVEQVFRPDVPFPGYRLKEVEQICGGTINFRHMADTALRDLGLDDVTQAAKIVYAFRQGVSAKNPLIYVESIETGRTRRPVTEADLVKEQQDETFDMDCLDIPPLHHHNPDGLTFRELWDKRDTSGKAYWTQASLAQQSIASFMAFCGIQRREIPRQMTYIRHPNIDILSNRDFGYGTDYPITSLADLENMRFLGNGYRLQHIQKTGDAKVDFVKKMELRLWASYLATAKPLGDEFVKDRPIVLDRDVLLEEMQDITNAGKYKTVHGRLSDTFKIADTDAQAKDHFAQGWRTDKLVDNPSKPFDYDLDHWASLAAVSGAQRVEDDFRVGMLGSASSPLQLANEHALQISTLLAMAGLSKNDGGGTRYIMQKFLLGYFDTWRQTPERLAQSYSFRTPFVSRKEGSLERFLREQSVSEGDIQRFGKHMNVRENFNFYHKDFLGSRQHGLLGSSDAVVNLAGGAGTAYEYNAVMLSNGLVALTGKGLFPGLNNAVKIPLIFIDTMVRNAKGEVGFYQPLFNSLTPKEKALAWMERAVSPTQCAQKIFTLAERKNRHVYWGPVPRP